MVNKFIPPLEAGGPQPAKRTEALFATLGVALATLLAPAPNAAAQQPFPFAGVWVVKMPGAPLLETFSISASDGTGTNSLMFVNSVIADPTLEGVVTNAQSLTLGVGCDRLVRPGRRLHAQEHCEPAQHQLDRRAGRAEQSSRYPTQQPETVLLLGKPIAPKL